MSDLRIEESVSIENFLAQIKIDSKEHGDKVLDKLADKTVELSIAQLRQISRSGVRYGNRVPMYQDVKKTKTKTGRRVGGGKDTGTLWHIVNDGTYRTKAWHFIDNVIRNLDSQIDSILNEVDL